MKRTYLPRPMENNLSILRKKMKGKTPVSDNPLSGSKARVFSQEEESVLVGYVQQMLNIVYRLTVRDVQTLAEQLLLKNRNNDTPRTTFMLKTEWVSAFLNRHPKVKLRLISDTNVGFNMAEVKYFYENLQEIYKLQNISPDRVYSTEDLEVSSLTKHNNKFIRTAKETGPDRYLLKNEAIVVKACLGANSEFFPSMVVLSPKDYSKCLLMSSQRIWTIRTESGYIDTEAFAQWLKTFVRLTRAMKDRPVVLFFDGQAAYVKNIEILHIAQENGIILISFPPCTRDLLQPLNNELVSSLNNYYIKEFELWLRYKDEPTAVSSVVDVVNVFEKAFFRCILTTDSSDYFKTRGIFPLDSTIFKESDFQRRINEVSIHDRVTPPLTEMNNDSSTENSGDHFDIYNNPKPGCSFWSD